MRPSGFGVGLLALFQIAVAMTTGPSTINRHSQGDIFSHQGSSSSSSLVVIRRKMIARYTSIQAPRANAMLRLACRPSVSAIMEASLLPGSAATASASAPWTDQSTAKTSSNALAPSTVCFLFFHLDSRT